MLPNIPWTSLMNFNATRIATGIGIGFKFRIGIGYAAEGARFLSQLTHELTGLRFFCRLEIAFSAVERNFPARRAAPDLPAL
jgi:hypothetical protein